MHTDSFGAYCCGSVEKALWTIFSFFAVKLASCCCYPCIILQQAQITAGEDPLPDNADLILIDVHEEVLSADDWVDLFRSLMRVRTCALILIESSRERLVISCDREKSRTVSLCTES